MPGSVQNAATTTVMPASLCCAFVREQQVPVLECEYPDGSSQRKTLAASSRKRWRLSKRLTPAQLATLRDFYEARKGAHEPFHFYDPYESNPKFSSDPTGVSPDGRYVVRFDGAFSQEAGMGRANVDITLIQLA
jgi:phage-related protein